MLPKFLTTLAAKLIMAAILVAVVLLSVKSCSDGRKAGEQGKQAGREAVAATETAKDVAATVIANAEENASLDDLVAETQREIENATDAKVSGAAARAAICRMHDNPKPSGC